MTIYFWSLLLKYQIKELAVSGEVRFRVKPITRLKVIIE